MKVQIFSDSHADYPGSRGLPPLVPGVQLVVVAGDTREGLVKALTELRLAYPRPIEIAAVAGNHEFYGSVWSREIEDGWQTAEALRIHFLENNMVTIGKLRIVGATLWTDYELFGSSLRELAMRAAYDVMLDHRRIKWQQSPWLRFRPHEARMLHLRSRAYIENQLAKVHDGPTLVLTHHAPCIEAVAPPLQGYMTSAAYASDMLSIIDRYQPELWVSGHTHVSMNFRRGRTRLVSNPIGYGGENPLFDPFFAVEIDA